MKLRLLTLVAPLVLVGCGDAPVAHISGGEETPKADATAMFTVNKVLLSSNYHVSVSSAMTGIEVGKSGAARAFDFDNGKVKILYNGDDNPYYFDFTENNNTSSSYSFYYYFPGISEGKVEYDSVHFKNQSFESSFLGLLESMQTISGLDGHIITFPTGISFSDFEFVGGVYKSDKEIKTSMFTIDAFEFSFTKESIKQIYIHYYAEHPTDGNKVTCAMKFTFSQHGQVSVTMPGK